MLVVLNESDDVWSSGLLQCTAVCCSVLQRVAACCSVLQCVVVCCSVLQCVLVWVVMRKSRKSIAVFVVQPIAFECHLILISNLNLIGLFSTERCKRDLENCITD